MRIRRKTAGLAALGTVVSGVVLATVAWGQEPSGPMAPGQEPTGQMTYEEAPPPLKVTVGEPSCQSQVVLGTDIGTIPTVNITLEATESGRSISYEILVDGQNRSGGAVSGNGSATTSVSVSKGRPTRIEVQSEGQVVADQTVTANCDKPNPAPSQQ